MATSSRLPLWMPPIILTLIVGVLIILALGYFFTLTEADGTLRRYLTILAFTGALGGIIGRVIADDRLLSMMWFDAGDRAGIRCGFIADSLIGLGGAWGVFLVLGRSMQLGTRTEDLMVLIGLGIVAGFTARTLLKTLGENIERQVRQNQQHISQLQRQTERSRAVQMSNLAQIIYTDVESTFTEFDNASDIQKRAMRDRLEELQGTIERLVQSDPESAEALHALARVKRRLAMIATGDNRESLLGQSISLLGDAIQRDPQNDYLYYNRACFRSLLASPPIPAIRDDIQQAIQLSPENKELFRTDPDLDTVRDAPEIAAVLA